MAAVSVLRRRTTKSNSEGGEMKTFTVATFVHEQSPGRYLYTAYTRDYNPSWNGCKIYTIEAQNGSAARNIAKKMRKAECEKSGSIVCWDDAEKLEAK